jgi:PAS domain S-box-containing protein
MDVQLVDPAQEVKRLQRCINDLVSVLSLSSIWRGSEPAQNVQTLLDVLLRMLSLDFAYARLNEAFGPLPVEILRIAEDCELNLSAEELRNIPGSLFAADATTLPRIRSRLGVEETSIFPVPLGIQGEIGVLVVGSDRVGFPEKTESLLLSVAANQAAIGLHEARLRNHQKRISDELDQQVGQRTAELAAANAQLQLQVGLLQHLPVSAWTLKPDGTPDFVNRVWLEYSGQTLDFVRSHPEAWMTAVHPDDREKAAKTFWDGVSSGQGFAFETRSLRAQDGTYRWLLQQSVVLRDEEDRIVKFVGTTTDIHEQKLAEEALREREQSLRLILDGIAGLVAIMGPTGELEAVNRQVLEYFGRSIEEMRGWSTGDAVHPDDLPGVISSWTHSFETLTPYDMDHRLRRADGAYRWFHARGLPLLDAEGRIVRWYVLLTDIDDRRRTEEALRTSEVKMRRVIDTIPTLTWCNFADGPNEFLSKSWHQYTGLSPEEAQGWGWSAAFHPDDLPPLMKRWQELLISGEPGEIESRIRRQDGVYRWFLIRVAPFRNETGTIIRWYGTSTDIEDRKRAEDALLANERNLGLIINTMPVLAWSAQASGNVDFVNQRWLDYTGLSPAQAQGWGWAEAFHPDDLGRLNDYWLSTIVAGQPGEIESRLRRSDGSYRWFLFRASPLRDESGAIVKWYGTNTDIDDRKRAEEELRNAQSELSRVMRVTTMGQLTASIAHEVNQPLSGIITNASTCLRMLDTDPPNLEGARETARRMIRDGHRAADVITRLRTLYSKKEPTLEPMDLNETAREVTALTLTEIQKNGVILRQEYADDLPPTLGDRIQLQQVILNLLRNAVDAMSTIDSRPRELLLRTERDEGNQVRLSVKDSGIGFTSQAADKIFEAFYTTKTDGMGIGLSISRSIVEAHQGRLWAAANEGPGSTFSFSIPCGTGGSTNRETGPTRSSGEAA